MIETLALTVEDLEEMLPSGKKTKFADRSSWANTYLAQAGLIQRPDRGHVQLTERGRQALLDADKGTRIDKAYLLQFPEFVDFVERSKRRQPTDVRKNINSPESPNEPIELDSQTPQETIESGYQALRAAIAGELLDRIKAGSPRFFERIVLDLLLAMGYGGSWADAAQAVGRSGDGGIDGIIKEDKLGLESIYLQAKRWSGTVGREVVQAFAGSLQGHRARKGVFITTSKFSQEAREFVASIDTRIVLIDGDQLTNLMIDHGVGLIDVAMYSVKRIDEDYFEEAE